MGGGLFDAVCGRSCVLFEGSQLLSKMRRDDCSDGGVSGDGGGDGKERGGDEEGDR